jgi:hypothetical protein
MYLGLFAGLVLAAANAVLATHLLRRRGSVPVGARYAAVTATGSAAAALCVVMLQSGGTEVSLAIAAVVGMVTAELATSGTAGRSGSESAAY